ncbi:hypothetical protein [Dokdonella sp.]|uniref:hypothetical protein n=1 Tax=Dokdonella sp. TaxID=2291710 RepID=UPI003C35D20F
MEDNDHDVDWNHARHRHSTRRQANGFADSSSSRFAVAISVFLAVAFVYPWYLYWVDSVVATWRLSAFSEEMENIAAEVQAETRERTAKATEANRREQRHARIAKVRVKGVSDGSNGPVAIVDLGSASLTESSATICRQTSAWLRKNMTGVSLKIQRYRLNQPALDAGTIDCR